MDWVGSGWIGWVNRWIDVADCAKHSSSDREIPPIFNFSQVRGESQTGGKDEAWGARTFVQHDMLPVRDDLDGGALRRDPPGIHPHVPFKNAPPPPPPDTH